MSDSRYALALKPRSQALDILRSLAILGMMLSGVVPWDGLPGWMYHRQEPPPSHEYQPLLSGITWVDLVFPSFLFCMGVAIPMSESKPIKWLQRWGMLVAFAIFNQHTRPYTLGSSPTNEQWLTGLFAFGLTLLMFGSSKWLRAIGFLGAGLLLAFLRYPDGSGFQKERGDIIILVLGAVGFFGTAIWHFTKEQQWIRLVLGGAMMAIRLVDWQLPVVGWFLQPAFLGYLGIVLPATVVGEWLLRQPLVPDDIPEAVRWLGWISVPWSLIVLYSRWPALLVVLPMCLMLAARTSLSENLKRFLMIAASALFLGAILEPLQGGMKKDPPTFSYILISFGLAVLLIVSLTKREKGSWLADVGKNPLLAYQAITHLVAPVWALTLGGWVASITPGPYLGMVSAVIRTGLLAVAVWGFSKAKLFLKA